MVNFLNWVHPTYGNLQKFTKGWVTFLYPAHEFDGLDGSFRWVTHWKPYLQLGFTHGWNKFYQRNQFSLSNPTNHHSSNHWVTNQITTRRVESQALHSNVPRVFHESHNLEIALWVRVVGVGQFSLWIRPLSAEHWSQEYPEHPEEDLQDFRGAEMRLDFR